MESVPGRYRKRYPEHLLALRGSTPFDPAIFFTTLPVTRIVTVLLAVHRLVRKTRIPIPISAPITVVLPELNRFMLLVTSLSRARRPPCALSSSASPSNENRKNKNLLHSCKTVIDLFCKDKNRKISCLNKNRLYRPLLFPMSVQQKHLNLKQPLSVWRNRVEPAELIHHLLR